MEFMSAFNVCASGLAAQRAKMDVIVSNLANINTTRSMQQKIWRLRRWNLENKGDV
jgi:flagellar basal body rod protein FlgC